MGVQDTAKLAAAVHAASMVQSGMLVGLGTGSTAALFVAALAERVRAQGLKVTGVPTSEATARQATAAGIALSTLEEHPKLDLNVDGADAADPALNLVKGLGGALLREKIVAAAAARFVVVMGEDKLVEHLSRARVIPVEVVPFGWSRTKAALEGLGAVATLRPRPDAPAQPFVTDGGHYLLDCAFGNYEDAQRIATAVKAVIGVVDHGLFIGMASEAVVGRPDGSVRVIKPR